MDAHRPHAEEGADLECYRVKPGELEHGGRSLAVFSVRWVRVTAAQGRYSRVTRQKNALR